MPWDTIDHDADRAAAEVTDDTLVAGRPVVVRRHAGVAVLIGGMASTVAIAYLWRASQTFTALDWALCGVMSLIAGGYLAALVDARTPLLVADDLGVRIRLGSEWRGLPWEAIRQVVVHPRKGLLRDGRIVFAPHSLARALDGLESKARRHIALNQKMYGAGLAVPIGLTSRVSTGGDQSVTEEIKALALGRAEVVEVDLSDRGRQPRTAAAPLAEGTKGAGLAEGTAQRSLAEGAREAHEVSPPDAGSRTPSTGAVAATPAGPHGPGEDRPTHSEGSMGGAADRDASDDDQGSRDDRPAGMQRTVRAPRGSIVGGIGTIVSRVAKGRAHDIDAPTASPAAVPEGAVVGHPDTGPAEEHSPSTHQGAPDSTPAAGLGEPGRWGGDTPLRATRPGLRAEATLTFSGSVGTALQASRDEDRRAGLPEGKELRRPGSVDLVVEPVTVDDRVRAISTLGDPVEPLVIDDFVTEPAYDPVIGPELTAARTRLGLSVDELAERTRIRPHVIESIEVDDFAPCGGDFYARGHLRTLARILGKDVDPLLETFEERYATAPVNARRVFEAELATGMTGSMRSTVGGPNWGLLVGVVLTLVLVWGVVRLFTTEPVDIVEVPAPVLGSAAVVESAPEVPAAPSAVRPAVEPVAVRLSASQSDSRVVVRDGDGTVVFSGEMVLGERRSLEVSPPVRVRAADGGALEIRVAGRDRGLLGQPGEPVRRTFLRR